MHPTLPRAATPPQAGRGVLTPRAPGAVRVCVIAAAGTTQR